MNINIQQILLNGEGIGTEFKEARNQLPESLFETICAFLNRNGGVVLLGVTDKAEVTGVDPESADKMIRNLVNLSNNPQLLSPSFLLEASTVEYAGKLIISIFVPASSQVHRFKSKVFDRSADGDFELKSDQQIKQLYTRKNSLYTENTIYPYLYETDFVPGLVERVRKLIRINRPDHPWNELTDREFFHSAGLYRRDLATGTEGFTLAALLLFGKSEHIQSAVPHYKIDALLRRKDIDRYDDRENIRCNLVEAYDSLMAFVAKHLPDKFYLEGDLRISLRDKIFREIVANLLIHREYTNAYPSGFVIYNNRLEVKNANKPHVYGLLSPDNFEPFPKNPHIARIFTQMGRSEELGTGLRNVLKYCKAYSGSSDFQFIEEDVFITRIPLPNYDYQSDIKHDRVSEVNSDPLNDPLNDPLSGPLNQRQLRLIQIIREGNNITQEQLAGTLQVSLKTIKRDIETLKNKQLIRRAGSRKTGGYVIINTP